MTTGQGQFDYLGLLNEDPQTAYYAKLYGGGQKLSPNQSRYYQGGQGFNDVWSSYLGTLGEGLVKAQEQNMPFEKFLNSQGNTAFYDYLSQTPFTERYAKLPQELRGGTSRFAPQTRWV